MGYAVKRIFEIKGDEIYKMEVEIRNILWITILIIPFFNGCTAICAR